MIIEDSGKKFFVKKFEELTSGFMDEILWKMFLLRNLFKMILKVEKWSDIMIDNWI